METKIIDENTVFFDGVCYKAYPSYDFCSGCDFELHDKIGMCLMSPPCTARCRSDKENVIFVKEVQRCPLRLLTKTGSWLMVMFMCQPDQTLDASLVNYATHRGQYVEKCHAMI